MRYSFGLLWLLLFFISCQGEKDGAARQAPERVEVYSQTDLQKSITDASGDFQEVPENITRSIIQDRTGNIWLATFTGVYKYDGKHFVNMTKAITDSRFFSALEDQHGDLWFGTIGGGVYKYNGNSFQQLTTDHGLINNEVTCIYEDQAGNIWFGANGGVSLYNGQSFQNFVIRDNNLTVAIPGIALANMKRPPNEINSITEDREGRVWIATRGRTFVYDYTTSDYISYAKDQNFSNVRHLLRDSKGNIWLAGSNGLWVFNGQSYKQVYDLFVGYCYEDRNGMIWISAEASGGWSISTYDPETTKITNLKTVKGMYFGIHEDAAGYIWVGSLNGALRYNGKEFEDFK